MTSTQDALCSDRDTGRQDVAELQPPLTSTLTEAAVKSTPPQEPSLECNLESQPPSASENTASFQSSTDDTTSVFRPAVWSLIPPAPSSTAIWEAFWNEFERLNISPDSGALKDAGFTEADFDQFEELMDRFAVEIGARVPKRVSASRRPARPRVGPSIFRPAVWPSIPEVASSGAIWGAFWDEFERSNLDPDAEIETEFTDADFDRMDELMSRQDADLEEHARQEDERRARLYTEAARNAMWMKTPRCCELCDRREADGKRRRLKFEIRPAKL